MKYSAPALHQGIMLLEALNTQGNMSLEGLARETALPKSTMLRLLETLGQHGWVKRETHNKTFESLVTVKHKVDHSAFDEEQVKKELAIVSAVSGCTAEWYVLRADGLEITQRVEPTDNLVFVKAQIGFSRKFNGEFDAVNRVAAKLNFHPKKSPTECLCFAKKDCETVLAKDKQKLLNEIKEDLVTYDQNWNSNGVRRFAVGVCDKNSQLQGVIGLAESFTPSADTKVLEKLELLRKVKFKMEASEKL